MILSRFYIAVIFLAFVACSKPSENVGNQVETTQEEENPAMPGFNTTGSDAKAVAIADSVMKAMGGRDNWDDTRYIAWNFFGARDLVWDKASGNVRVESPRDSTIYLVNIKDGTGMVAKDTALIEEDSLASALVQRGISIWRNDAYWLVMPFKLKDNGVTLKYVREESSFAGDKMAVLSLTFDNVGDTPDNKYEVYVDLSDYLIYKWSYFKNAKQDTASATWPFDNYQQYGNILLSGDRSDGKGPKNVKVFDKLPKEVFSSFEPVDWEKL